MSKTIKKIGENDPLPSHIKDPEGNELNFDEIRVQFICEFIFATRILTSDRPDLYAENRSFGIEVTSASDIPCTINRTSGGSQQKATISYNQLEGMKCNNMRKNGTIDKDLCFAIVNANTATYQSAIIHAVIDKLKKLNGTKGKAYTEYPIQILYITSIVDLSAFSINELVSLFDSMCDEQRKYQKFFAQIFVECINGLIKFDFLCGQAYFMPGVFKDIVSQAGEWTRRYVIAKHNGDTPPDDPYMTLCKLSNLMKS